MESEDGDDSLYLDDLQGLRAELEELQEALGEDYVALARGAGEESDEEAAAPPLPGAARPSPPQSAEPSPAETLGRRQQQRRRRQQQQQQHASEEEEEEEQEEHAETSGSEGSEAEEEEAGRATPHAGPWEAEEEDEGEAAAQTVAFAFAPRTGRIAAAVAARQAAAAAAAAAARSQSAGPSPSGASGGRQRSAGGRGKQAAGSKGKEPAKGKAGKGKQPPAGKAAKGKQLKQPGKRRRSRQAAADDEAAAAAAAAPPPPASKLQAVREALEANRMLQERLRRLLGSVGRASNRNAALLQRVKTLHATKNAPPAVAAGGARGDVPLRHAPAGASWFWGAAEPGAEPPPPNPDAATLQGLLAYLPYSFRPAKWSEEEQQRLRDGVLQLVQELQLQDAMQEMQQRLESGGAVSMADLEASRQRIQALTLQAPAVAQLAAAFGEEDWQRLLDRTHLKRTITECRLQWANCLAPNLSQEAWSGGEDEALRRLVRRHGERQWGAVSAELAAATGGAPRPPLACLQRWRQLAAAPAKEGRLLGAQADLIGDALTRLSGLVVKHGNSWKRIADEYGGGWEPDQLMHIWRRHAQRGQQARRGKWTPEEDEAMAVHGRKWSLVARLVAGRTDVQCRERFMNVLNPDIDAHAPWSKEEEAKLLELAEQHKRQEDGRVRWAAVAKALPGRTDKNCAVRHKYLTTGVSKGARSKKGKGSGSKQSKGGSKKRQRSAAPSSGAKRRRSVGAAVSEGEQQQQQADEEMLEQQQAEQQQQQQQQLTGEAEPARGATQRPRRQRGQKRQLDEEQDVQRQQQQQQQQQQLGGAGGQAVAEESHAAATEPPEGPLLEAAPPATASVLPFSPRGAIGERVAVWWLQEDGGSSGRMYPATITRWDPPSRRHSVRYDGETRTIRCKLDEETVAWLGAGGAVTAPGAAWPAVDGERGGAGAPGAGGGRTSRSRSAVRAQARADSPTRLPAAGGPAPAARRPAPRRPAAPIPAASTLAPLAKPEAPATPVKLSGPPTLPQPWEQMDDAARHAYLQAVRDYNGRGVVLEFFDVEAGRSLMALVEPEMVQVWREYSWREDPVDGLVGSRRSSSSGAGDEDAGSSEPSSSAGEPSSSGGSAAAAEAAEEVQLHVLTAERIHVGGSLPDFVDVCCSDGCPANCLVDNLTLKPWEADASASGEWLQFRSRLEERWQWMQLEERYEKLAAEQAQRERRALLMQAARRRLEAAAGAAPTGPSLPATLGDAAEVAVAAELVAGGLDVAPAPPKPSPTDSMSSEEIDALMTGFFADPKGQAPQLMAVTSASDGSSSGGLGSADAAGPSPSLLGSPAPQLLLAAISSAGASSAAAPAEQEEEEEEAARGADASSSAPRLVAPWRDMSTEERRSYLEAVRDYQGRGIVCERTLRSGRTVLALVDPEMRQHWQAHSWRDEARDGACRLFTESGPHAGGRTYLAHWTAEACVLSRCTLPFTIVRLEHKDGCPANCLLSNLELELRPALQQGGAASSSGFGGAAAEAASAPTAAANNIVPHALPEPRPQPPQPASGGAAAPALAAARAEPAMLPALAPSEAAPAAGHLRAAKLEARQSLRAVYDWLGAERGREFFEQLHAEYLEAEREQQQLEARRDAAAVLTAAAAGGAPAQQTMAA